MTCGFVNHIDRVDGIPFLNAHLLSGGNGHGAHWFAENRGATNYNGVLTFDIDFIVFQNAHNAGRGCRTVSGFAHGHTTKTQTGYSIYIFVERNGIVQSAPAPRFSETPGEIQCEPVAPGNDTRQILEGLGLDAEGLIGSGAVAQAEAK